MDYHFSLGDIPTDMLRLPHDGLDYLTVDYHFSLDDIPTDMLGLPHDGLPFLAR